MTTQVPVKRPPEARGDVTRPFELFDQMEEWMKSMMPWRPHLPESLAWTSAMPQIDIVDREAELLVRCATPGFTKDDIEVTTTNDAVTIRGTRRAETEEKGEYYRKEIRREDFLRTVHLPALVDDTKAKASFKDGVLELVLPKVEKARRHTLKIE
ncbi:MAG: Hsp20/alpha crystallin family protein [Pseudomonadota bacterium]|nr:MAG: Hsp20/alpha crystallin family protein [Pseudomonadota bacterium]